MPSIKNYVGRYLYCDLTDFSLLLFYSEKDIGCESILVETKSESWKAKPFGRWFVELLAECWRLRSITNDDIRTQTAQINAGLNNIKGTSLGNKRLKSPAIKKNDSSIWVFPTDISPNIQVQQPLTSATSPSRSHINMASETSFININHNKL